MGLYKDVLDALKLDGTDFTDNRWKMMWWDMLHLLGEKDFELSVDNADYVDVPDGFNHFWYRWHKSFRQVDIADGICRAERLGGGRFKIEEWLYGHIDSLIWEMIHADERGVLYNVMKKLIQK